MKKTFLFTLLLLAVAATGCIFKKDKSTATAPAVAAPQAIVTPDLSLAAKVISVNTVGRFVVLSFPAGQMPKPQQTLFLYREGLKVAEIKITGPQQGNDIVADLVSGEAKTGDTVRNE
ncbi:MAG TPA: hypothetical protein VIK53_09470 [Verrucomicrobiae bacterium]